MTAPSTIHGDAPSRRQHKSSGFTLIEILFVLTLIGILAGIAVPMYHNSLVRAKESALKEDLYQMREAIDKYYADRGEYPPGLSVLAEKKYIRFVPTDPFTGSRDTWVVINSEDRAGIFDVKSGSELSSGKGELYSEW